MLKQAFIITLFSTLIKTIIAFTKTREESLTLLEKTAIIISLIVSVAYISILIYLSNSLLPFVNAIIMPYSTLHPLPELLPALTLNSADLVAEYLSNYQKISDRPYIKGNYFKIETIRAVYFLVLAVIFTIIFATLHLFTGIIK